MGDGQSRESAVRRRCDPAPPHPEGAQESLLRPQSSRTMRLDLALVALRAKEPKMGLPCPLSFASSFKLTVLQVLGRTVVA